MSVCVTSMVSGAVVVNNLKEHLMYIKLLMNCKHNLNNLSNEKKCNYFPEPQTKRTNHNEDNKMKTFIFGPVLLWVPFH